VVDVLNRSHCSELLIRSDGTGRTIYGLVMPFGSTAEVDDGAGRYRERFMPGSFTRTIAERGQRVKLMVQHARASALPIGRAEEMHEDRSGLVGSFRVSKTQQGDEALELVRDGVVDSFSCGFRPMRQRTARDGAVERTEVALREVSLVSFPAYDLALIGGVRAADTPRILTGRAALLRLAELESVMNR
jgi:uncharacterized protein